MKIDLTAKEMRTLRTGLAMLEPGNMPKIPEWHALAERLLTAAKAEEEQAAPTTAENVDERRERLSDIKPLLRQLESAFDCAESCETPTDFDANLRDMDDAIGAILLAMKEVRDG